jgi:hypothetical protein
MWVYLVLFHACYCCAFSLSIHCHINFTLRIKRKVSFGRLSPQEPPPPKTSLVSWNCVRVKEGRLHAVRQGILFVWAESHIIISSLSAKCAERWTSVCCVALCGAYISQMLHPCTFCSFIILSGQMFCNILDFKLLLCSVCFLLGNSPASEFYMPTFRNSASHLHSK